MCSEPHTTYTFSKELNFAHLHVLKLGQYLKKRRNGIWLKIALLSQIWAQGVLVHLGIPDVIEKAQHLIDHLETKEDERWMSQEAVSWWLCMIMNDVVGSSRNRT